MVVQTFNPRIQKIKKGRQSSVFKASLVYRASYKTARATQPVSKITTTTTTKKPTKQKSKMVIVLDCILFIKQV